MIPYYILIATGSLVFGLLILIEIRKEKINAVDPVVSHDKTFIPVEPDHELKQSSYPVSDNETSVKIKKLEELLAEKNAQIVRLQNVLDAQRRHEQEFEKIKSLFQWQLFQSKEINREIRKELSDRLLTDEMRGKEFHQLKTELTFKEQLISQQEVKINDLKNRLNSLLPQKSSEEPADADNLLVRNIESLNDYKWRKQL